MLQLAHICPMTSACELPRPQRCSTHLLCLRGPPPCSLLRWWSVLLVGAGSGSLGIGEIAGDYDAFLIDLWGVIHDGKVAFPWALDALAELKKAGKPVVFLSNSSRRTEVNIATLTKLGFSRDLYVDIVSSGEEAWRALAYHGTPDATALAKGLPAEVLGAQRVFVFGNGADDEEYLAGLAPRRVASIEEADMLLARGCATIPGEQAAMKKASWAEMEEVLRLAAGRKLPLLVANPDVVRPDGADSPMPGRLARRYVELGGPTPSIVGKPHAAIFDVALERLRASGVPAAARVCMIGDSAWQDVRGARACGLDVVLLCNGIHSAALGLQQAPSPPQRPASDRLQAFLGALPPDEAPTYVAGALAWDAASTSASARPAVIACGLACLDIAQQVGEYPQPDAKVRADSGGCLGGGNAANTACALARMGTRALLMSQVGDDPLGDAILEGLRSEGADVALVARPQGMNSAFTNIVVDRSSDTRTCIHSPMAKDLSGEDVEQLLAKSVEADSPSSSPLLTLGVKHVHLDCRHPAAAAALVKAALEVPDIRISIDVDRPRAGLDQLMPHCTAIFCNSTFPQTFTGKPSLVSALAAMLDRFPKAQFVVATQGSKGDLLVSRASSPFQLEEEGGSSGMLPVKCCRGTYEGYSTLFSDSWPLPADAKVVDSTGAGDVFIAGFIHAWLANRPLSLALATGAYIATQQLQRFGARLGRDVAAEELPCNIGA
mmetsp:Transcript_138721/g.442485  ORF Transcript_138721/g.442485 Transcript_138721/m.442485 type:complete len:721 (-) Transcript_138721:12-2174(-)